MMYICNKCGRQLKDIEFYTKRDKTKAGICKKCMTMHVDNYDPETFLWILQEVDVPYVEAEWTMIRDKAAATAGSDGLTGMSVVGKYISKMKLRQWINYTWADTEKIAAERAAVDEQLRQQREAFNAEMQVKLDAGEITESEYKYLTAPDEPVTVPIVANPISEVKNKEEFFNENNFIPEEAITDPSLDLTTDDKKALAIKWGRFYKPQEWLELERTYQEMENSFDIQDADTKNTLILLCKTNLKMNQSMDMGDIDGAQKLSKMYESLRKSAKFTAAQNKEEKSDFVDSIGELVSLCEREGFIPRFATDIPQDKVDLTLKDMNGYLNKLVTQDLGFGKQIEDALKKIQIQKELNETEEQAGGEAVELEDEDFSVFYEEVQKQKEFDAEGEGEE